MIIWLEDRADTVVMISNRLRKSGLHFIQFPSLIGIDFYIGDHPERSQDFVFVLDLMLTGVHDLSSLGITNAPTQHGANAGLVFAERYLRSPHSPLRECPICFLTERTVNQALSKAIDALSAPGSGPTAIFNKYKGSEIDGFVAQMKAWNAQREGA